MTSRWTLVGLALAGLCGCGNADSNDDSSSDHFGTSGKLGVPVPATVGLGVLFVGAALDGFGGGTLVVDTGSPFTFVDTNQFPGSSLPPELARAEVELGIGALTISGVEALRFTANDTKSLHFGGILGADVLRHFAVQFNYRDQQFRIGDGPAPADVAEPGATVDFTLRGGGQASAGTQTFEYPATRILLTATVEGAEHTFMLDTGASAVTVRQSLFDQLTADHRPILDDFPVSTAAGDAAAHVTRAHSIAVSGEEVKDLAVLCFGDTLLDTLSGDAGRTIDGLLGGTFLNAFALTIDYPAGSFTLQRYAAGELAADEFQRVGVSVAFDASGNVVVSTVFSGSDAEKKGLAVGDELLQVDGQDTKALDPIRLDELLMGTPGTVRTLTLGHASSPSLSNAEVDVTIDDLVPAAQ